MVRGIKNAVVLMCFFSATFTAHTQSPEEWQLKIGVNYAHGFITENTQTTQFQVNLGFEKNKFEARLDAFYFLGQQGDRKRFSVNNQVFLGGYYYFFNKKIRPYAGAQIGLAYAKSTEYGTLNAQSQLNIESAINPVFSFGGGLDYCLNSNLDFNFECRQIYGKHISNSYPTYLDEFRISIGLGFYFRNKSTN